jgi:Uma2 family endonuclease
MSTVQKRKRKASCNVTAAVPPNGTAFKLLSSDRGIVVPTWIVDHASYRRWATSDDFPNIGWISYLDGLIWVDLNMERVIHNQIKGQIGAVLAILVQSLVLGRVFADHMLITKRSARLSTEPDGLFVSYDSIRTGRVLLKKGDDTLELEGSPDMTLEVVSASSVEKDTEHLPRLYWQAGVREYWLVDPRGNQLKFDILRWMADGYEPVRKRNGWVKSDVFGKSFRLTQSVGPDGMTDCRLEVR